MLFRYETAFFIVLNIQMKLGEYTIASVIVLAYYGSYK